MKKFSLFLVSLILMTLAKVQAATITITIDESVYQRVLDGFATQNGYQSKIQPNGITGPFIDNPETKDMYLNRLLSKFIVENVAASEANLAAKSAAQNAISNVGGTLTPLIQTSSVSQVVIK